MNVNLDNLGLLIAALIGAAFALVIYAFCWGAYPNRVSRADHERVQTEHNELRNALRVVDQLDPRFREAFPQYRRGSVVGVDPSKLAEYADKQLEVDQADSARRQLDEVRRIFRQPARIGEGWTSISKDFK